MATYPLTKEEAKAALRAAAWTKPANCGECGRPLENPDLEPLIHSRLGGIGADNLLSHAFDTIDRATDLGWQPDLLGHELAVLLPNGRVYRYEVRAPAEIRAAWTRKVEVQVEEG